MKPGFDGEHPPAGAPTPVPGDPPRLLVGDAARRQAAQDAVRRLEREGALSPSDAERLHQVTGAPDAGQGGRP